jgi:apolipoprotein N-acyltransferase
MAFSDHHVLPAQIARAVDALYGEAESQKSRLLILPEGLVEGGESIPPNTPFVVDPRIPVLFGGRRGNSPAFQTAYGYDGKWSYADKSRLVVFGEYVPGRDFLPFLTYFKLPSGDLKPALKVSALDVSGIRVGPLLCFEGLFYDIAQQQSQNGAQMLAVMSIDDWYMGTSAPDQLMLGSVWRAAETGLPLARSASLGYSLAVDQRGRIIKEAPLGTLDALQVDIQIERDPAKVPWRPLFVWASSIGTLSLAALEAARRLTAKRKHR